MDELAVEVDSGTARKWSAIELRSHALAAAVLPAKYRRVITPALRMNATTTIAIAPAQIVVLATSPLKAGMMT